MILERIHIDGFGILTNTDISLHTGLQIFYATNEQGKSTLLNFCRAVFYGIGGRNNSDISKSRDRFKPWQGGKWGGYIVFNQDGNRYRLCRYFGTTKAYDKIQLYNESTGKLLQDKFSDLEQPGDLLFKMGNNEFIATVFLSQNLDERYAEDKSSELNDRLSALFGAPDETTSYSTTKDRLEKAARALKRGRSNGGSLNKLENGLIDLQAELAEIEQKLREAEQVLAEFAESEAVTQTQKQKLKALETEISKINQLIYQHNKISELNQRNQAYKQAQKDVAEFAEAFSKWKVEAPLAKHLLDQLEAGYAQLIEYQQNFEKQRQILQSKQAELKHWQDNWQALQVINDEQDRSPFEVFDSLNKDLADRESKLAKWNNLAQGRQEIKELYAEGRRLTGESTKIQDLAAGLERDLKRQNGEVERHKAVLANRYQAVADQEIKCKLEEERLIAKSELRNQELMKKQSKYKAYLQGLFFGALIAGMLGIGLIVFSVSFLTAMLQQVGVFCGLIFLALGAALGVRRSIFKPTPPTPVSEPDAELALKQEQMEARNLREQCLEQEELIKTLAQNVEIQAQHLLMAKEQLQNISQLISSNKLQSENKAVELANLENNFDEVPRDSVLMTEINGLESELLMIKDQISDFLHRYDLSEAADVAKWQTETELCKANVCRFETEVDAASDALANLGQTLIEYSKNMLQKFPCLLPYYQNDEVLDKQTDLASLSSGDGPNNAVITSEIAAIIAVKFPPVIQLACADLDQNYRAYLRAQELLASVEANGNGQSLHDLQVEITKLKVNYLENLQNLKRPEYINLDFNQTANLHRWQDELYVDLKGQREIYQQQQLASQDVLHRYEELLSQEKRRQELIGVIDATRTEIQKQDQYHKALTLALEWLNNAAEQLESEFSKAMNGKISSYIARLTDNKYTDMHVSRDLALTVDTVTDGFKPSSIFSAGANDQLRLALRLAVTDFLDPEVNLPLLCDDPFVNFDQKRMCLAYQLLAALAREDGRQILLVTCHPAPNGFIPAVEECSWQVWNSKVAEYPVDFDDFAEPVFSETVNAARSEDYGSANGADNDLSTGSDAGLTIDTDDM